LNTYHIHINGIVQGVGFRPFVYQLAKKWGLPGYVKNGNDGVHLFFNAPADIAPLFFNTLICEAPGQSRIVSARMRIASFQPFTVFSILTEADSHQKQVLIAPDKAICPNCKRELHDINNRRFRYPFITCTHCGPRYSILSGLPYERHNTAVQPFIQCLPCEQEYNHISDRRFFSQTNSCTQCGPRLSIWDREGSGLPQDSEAVLSSVKHYLQLGKIVAVKGIGGYLLLCDAQNAFAIQLLRERKHRSRKPFALLYPDISSVCKDFLIDEKEITLLEGPEAPIVLLQPKGRSSGQPLRELIAPGLMRLGVMLPYNPLLDLIISDLGRPLIATSANISGSPIIYKDKEALTHLFSMADYIITHDREIIVPQDDSVVQVASGSGTQILLRRSRGYAPSFLSYQPNKKEPVLATGAFLKSSFAATTKDTLFISQFLGSGESYESQQMYKETLENWQSLYQVTPAIIIADCHPGYFSHQYALELSEKYLCEVQFVQHHEAHFAAVLAENGLLAGQRPVNQSPAGQAILGVIWDGTGLGTDGNIWGGEFFVYENKEIQRYAHFDYFPVIAGDKLAREPRMSALCLTHAIRPAYEEISRQFTDIEWNNYQSLLNTTKLFSSSAGRIFDAVASLLDICDIQTYEGEAALRLQVLAETYTREHGLNMDWSYFMDGSCFKEETNNPCISTACLMQGIAADIRAGRAGNYIATKFHYSLACLIGMVAKQSGCTAMCFSGGVFQNALLIDWIKKLYGQTHALFFHIHLSPNDENISFGQLAYYDHDLRSSELGHATIKESASNWRAALEPVIHHL
jgi:hydrogenase maturation protein HypF